MASDLDRLLARALQQSPQNTITPQPQTLMDTAAMATSPIPVLGDLLGLGADANALRKDPSWGNALAMALGALPFAPPAAAKRVFGGITRKTTGMPMYDDMMKNPEYFKTQKGKQFKIEEMSPERYFAEIGRQMDNNSIEPARVKKYAEKMREGEMFPMLTLEKSGGRITQEGQHRALAAKEVGIERVPVMVVEETPLEQALKRAKGDQDEIARILKAFGVEDTY